MLVIWESQGRVSFSPVPPLAVCHQSRSRPSAGKTVTTRSTTCCKGPTMSRCRSLRTSPSGLRILEQRKAHLGCVKSRTSTSTPTRRPTTSALTERLANGSSWPLRHRCPKGPLELEFATITSATGSLDSTFEFQDAQGAQDLGDRKCASVNDLVDICW